jgi:hypothetical protein
MSKKFILRILDQRFLTEDFTDVCSHGPIYLKVNDTVISDEDDGDWVINEAALSLMRTVKYGFPNETPPRYYPEGLSEDALINCCGAFMLFCPSNIRWNVEIKGDHVCLSNFIKHETIEYTGLQVTLPLRNYALEIYHFATEARKLFEGIQVDTEGWEHFEGQYKQFWNEYDELYRYIEKMI